jgi:hypothetical protein
VRRQLGEHTAQRTAQRTGARGKSYRPKIGIAFVHTVIDDHSRMAYAEICRDEKAVAAIGVLRRPSPELAKVEHRLLAAYPANSHAQALGVKDDDLYTDEAAAVKELAKQIDNDPAQSRRSTGRSTRFKTCGPTRVMNSCICTARRLGRLSGSSATRWTGCRSTSA